MSETVKKLYYSFYELIEDLHIIVRKIKDSKWEPDIIIGPCRGSYIPGVMLSHKLSIPFYGFMWQTRDGNVQDHNELIEILKNNKNKNILVIDDINDSGTTLNGISNEIDIYKANDLEYKDSIKYCVLFNKTQSNFHKVNYYATQLTPDNNPWVVFPYEEW